MTTINPNGNANEQLFAMREVYASTLLPKAQKKMGALAKSLKKMPASDGSILSGGGGNQTTPRLTIPFEDINGGNVGASFVRSYEESLGPQGDRFLAEGGQLWVHAPMTWAAGQWGKGSPGAVPDNWLRNRLDGPVQEWWRTLSAILWTAGDGAFSKSAPATVVGTNQMTLLNRRSIHRFHRLQKVLLVDQATPFVPGALRAPRAFNTPLTIVSINTTLGVLTFDQPITTAIPTAASTDYVTPYTFHLSADDVDAPLPPVGMFTWVPITNTRAIQPLYGVNRSVDPETRSGRRVEITATDKVSDIVAKIAEPLEDLPLADNDRMHGTIWIPSHKSAGLIEAMQKQNITVRMMPDRVNDRTHLQIGVATTAAVFPSGHIMGITTDRMMCDIDVTRDEDNTWLVTLEDGWSIKTGSDGITYQPDLGGRMLRQVDGSSQAMVASHGALLQLCPDLPGNNILLSPRANL